VNSYILSLLLAAPPEPAPPPATAPTAPAATHDVAEAHHDTVSLAQVFALLEERSPRYKVYQSDVDVAKAEITAARVLPNPTVNLAILYLNVGFNQNGVATYYANATLPLLIAGNRRMRVKTAKSGVRLAEADKELSYHELAHEARETFAELQAEQARIAVYDSALTELARLQALIVERRRSGVETDYDILRIDVEVSAWRSRRAEQEAEAEHTAGQLGVIVGIPEWNPRAEGELAPLGVRGKADDMWRDVEKTQPAVVAAREHEAYSDRAIELVKRERFPVPSVTFGTVAIQNYYSVSTTAGITVPLPIFDWGQGPIARAKANRQRAKRETEAVVATSKAELQRAMRLLEHHRHTLEAFDKDVIAKLPDLSRMAEDSFRAGDAQLIDLIDAARTRFEVELTRVDLVEKIVHAEIDVLAVTGRIESTEAPR
jgi:cobalt-zinc-cadmium efflux system outer membrane protein